MVDLSKHNFTSVIDKKVKPVKCFIDTYVDKLLESESAIGSMHGMRRVIDAKYKKADLNKVMTKQCQQLSAEER